MPCLSSKCPLSKKRHIKAQEGYKALFPGCIGLLTIFCEKLGAIVEWFLSQTSEETQLAFWSTFREPALAN